MRRNLASMRVTVGMRVVMFLVCITTALVRPGPGFSSTIAAKAAKPEAACGPRRGEAESRPAGKGPMEEKERAVSAMGSLFGNTLVVTSARGNARLWYDPDGTVKGVDDSGQLLGGTWTIDGTSLCTTILTPQPRPPHKGTLEPHAVGESWQDHRADGTVTQLRLEAGR